MKTTAEKQNYLKSLRKKSAPIKVTPPPPTDPTPEPIPVTSRKPIVDPFGLYDDDDDASPVISFKNVEVAVEPVIEEDVVPIVKIEKPTKKKVVNKILQKNAMVKEPLPSHDFSNSEGPGWDIDKLKAEKCKRSLYFFLTEFFSLVSTKDYQYSWHIEYLCDRLQESIMKAIRGEKKDKDLVCNLPTGVGKTTIINMSIAWAMAVDPKIRILYVSYQQEQAKKSVGYSRDLMKSDKYKLYFPNVNISATLDTQKNWMTTVKGEVMVSSPDSAATANHFDYLIIDDPSNPNIQESEAERESVNTFVDVTLSTRKTNLETAWTALIQQRLGSTDTSGVWLDRRDDKGNRLVDHICIPAELTKYVFPAELAQNYKDGLLNPDVRSKEALDGLKAQLGTRQYNAQILQNPQTPEDNIIKEEWLEIVSKIEFDKLVEKHKPVINFWCDTSYGGKSKRADFCAILATAYIINRLYVVNVSQTKLPFSEFLRHLKTWCDANGYTTRSKIYVEGAATGKPVVDVMKNSKFNVIEIKAPSTKKEQRLEAVEPSIQGGKLLFVESHWNKSLRDELCYETLHDDMRDTVIMAIENSVISKSGKKIWHGTR